MSAVGFRRDRSVAYVRSRGRAWRTRTVFLRPTSVVNTCAAQYLLSFSVLVRISHKRDQPPLSFISLSLTISFVTCSSRPRNLRPLVHRPDIHPLLSPLDCLVVTSSLDTSKPSPIDHKLRPIPTPSPAWASTSHDVRVSASFVFISTFSRETAQIHTPLQASHPFHNLIPFAVYRNGLSHNHWCCRSSSRLILPVSLRFLAPWNTPGTFPHYYYSNRYHVRVLRYNAVLAFSTDQCR